jgi:hypothetical protein
MMNETVRVTWHLSDRSRSWRIVGYGLHSQDAFTRLTNQQRQEICLHGDRVTEERISSRPSPSADCRERTRAPEIQPRPYWEQPGWMWGNVPWGRK